MPQKGLLFVINECPAAMEEELNAWYDSEHIPERLSIDGFLTASRHVSATRARRYLALYDLRDVGVLQSPGYMAFVGENFTPWTKRILSRTKVTRIEAVQVHSGDANAVAAPRHLVLFWKDVAEATAGKIVEASKHCFDGKPGVAQLRVFAGSGADTGSMLTIVAGAGDLEAHFDPRAFDASKAQLTQLETYLSY